MDNPGGKGGAAPPAKKQKTSLFGFTELATSGATDQSPSLTLSISNNSVVSRVTRRRVITNTSTTIPLIQRKSITIDSDGDLYLEVRQSHIFQVDSRTLCRHSPVFKAMLTGPWIESRPTESKWTVNLPEDSPQGLEVLLNIVHGRFDLVPTHLDGDNLFDVCVEADKRDMVKTVRPWIREWGMNLRLGGDHTRLTDLFIAWVLGLRIIYRDVIVDLVRTCNIKLDGSVWLYMKLTPSSQSQWVKLDQTLKGYSHAQSTGFLNQIRSTYKVCMDSFLQFLHRCWVKFANADPIVGFPRERAIIFGWFASGVNKLGLYANSSSMTLTQVYTLEALYGGIREIPDQIEIPHKTYTRIHESCYQAAEELRQGLLQLTENIPETLTESQRKHFKERAELLGINDGFLVK
ncbi:hypothetical protein PspLS_01142 [Pyricularia sp. CBS 133598]|nr:hypothetical protein PspLS_01142 [Pyricularia sp. CBS 133598]